MSCVKLIFTSDVPETYNVDDFQVWVKVSSFVRNCHYDVIGLEPNKSYNFRVRAENQYGISEPLETDSPIVAKFPFTVPDAPGQPRVIDWDSSGNVTISWDRPKLDGGSRVQGYRIEFRYESQKNWSGVNRFTEKS